MFDCLTLVGPQGKTLVDLNRAGSLHTAAATSITTRLKVLAADDAPVAVKQLVLSVGLALAAATPATTDRTLTYRVLARVLASTVDDRHAWDARNGRVDSAEVNAHDRHELRAFPSVVDALRDRQSVALMPIYRSAGRRLNTTVAAALGHLLP